MLLYYNFVTYYNYKYYFCLTYLKQIFLMKKIFTFLLFTAFCQTVFASAGVWRGSIDVALNGTTINYKSNAGTGTPLASANLGSLTSNSQTLTMNAPYLFSYKNSGCDVTGGSFQYRVYKVGAAAPAGTSVTFGFISNCGDANWRNSVSGCGSGSDQEWGSPSTSIDLKALAKAADPAGGSYEVQVKWTVSITNCGMTTSAEEGWITASFSATAAALPIVLSDLRLQKANNQNRLSWTTETEKNGSLFEIEKSVNGKSWAKLGEVVAKGNTTRRENYSFTDKNPAATNYYRLKMVDRDGSYEYSKIVSANNGKSTVVNLFPNPVQERLNINIESQDINEANIQVINMNGQVVLVSKNSIGRSNTPISIDANELQSGIYFIKITDENANVIGKEKFLKQ